MINFIKTYMEKKAKAKEAAQKGQERAAAAKEKIKAAKEKLEKDGGVWWTRGGTNRLIAGMVRHFERLGGTIRLGDPVVQIHTVGNRASEVETASGFRERFDAVASNADIMHSYRDLLSGTKRGKDYAKSLSKKSFSPGLFVVHFGLEGTWPGIPHHMILFGPRYKGLLDDIYKNGIVLITKHYVNDKSDLAAGEIEVIVLLTVKTMPGWIKMYSAIWMGFLE